VRIVAEVRLVDDDSSTKKYIADRNPRRQDLNRCSWGCGNPAIAASVSLPEPGRRTTGSGPFYFQSPPCFNTLRAPQRGYARNMLRSKRTTPSTVPFCHIMLIRKFTDAIPGARERELDFFSKRSICAGVRCVESFFVSLAASPRIHGARHVPLILMVMGASGRTENNRDRVFCPSFRKFEPTTILFPLAGRAAHAGAAHPDFPASRCFALASQPSLDTLLARVCAPLL